MKNINKKTQLKVLFPAKNQKKTKKKQKKLEKCQIFMSLEVILLHKKA